jgi:glucosamine 6-phosphate synthetase-like amidotransferase/phosphosugar isomerase protein
MCSIFGIGFQKDSSFEWKRLKGALSTAFLAAEQGGTDASGVAFVTKSKAIVVKSDVRASKFIMSKRYEDSVEEFLESDGKLSVLGHCRQMTQGSPKNNDNNHPIVTGNVIGIHNGIIGNDRDLFESTGLNRIAEVDSEIIFSLLNSFIHEKNKNVEESVKATSKALAGSYACAFVDVTSPHVLWLFRDSVPCSILHFQNDGVVMFATRDEYVTSASGICKLNGFKRMEFDRRNAIGVDLENGETCRKTLDDPESERLWATPAGYVTRSMRREVSDGNGLFGFTL